MLYAARGKLALASAIFTLAGMFRSNATMLVIYILWPFVVEPILVDGHLWGKWKSLLKKIPYSITLSIPPLLPFIWHQYKGYQMFCQASSQTWEARRWCSNQIPLIYSFVQSEYWNVGPFRYWTLQQLPNFLIAGPVLLLLFNASIYHIFFSLLPRFRILLGANYKRKANDNSDPILNPSLAPHAIHALALSNMLLVSAHTQIALRLVCALPFTYWAAARLFFLKRQNAFESSKLKPEDCTTTLSRAARWWVAWSILWGTISLVTWAVFLPPA